MLELDADDEFAHVRLQRQRLLVQLEFEFLALQRLRQRRSPEMIDSVRDPHACGTDEIHQHLLPHLPHQLGQYRLLRREVLVERADKNTRQGSDMIGGESPCCPTSPKCEQPPPGSQHK